jgi:hypothetical protein
MAAESVSVCFACLFWLLLAAQGAAIQCRFVDCCVLTVVVCFKFFNPKSREEFVGAVAVGLSGWLFVRLVVVCFWLFLVFPGFRVR